MGWKASVSLSPVLSPAMSPRPQLPLGTDAFLLTHTAHFPGAFLCCLEFSGATVVTHGSLIIQWDCKIPKDSFHILGISFLPCSPLCYENVGDLQQ